MSYDFRPSAEENINKAPIIAFAGPTGCGKTESALRLARGYCGPNEKFCIIDTEEKRALYKKTRYQPWDHLNLAAPFSPDNYAGALITARDAGYKAVIVDSFSHEWAGYGGVTDMADDALEALVKRLGERDAARLTATTWKEPKKAHKKLMNRLVISYPVLLIFCLRAERKIKFVKVKDEDTNRERMTVVDAGFLPICEKGFMFEMLVSCMMEGLPDGKPGVPIHIKPLEVDLEPVFKADEQVNEKTGERLREWAEKDTIKPVQKPADKPKSSSTEQTPIADRPALIKAINGLREKLPAGDWEKYKTAHPMNVNTDSIKALQGHVFELQAMVSKTGGLL